MRILEQPINIKQMTLRNRIVMPPMATSKAKDGYVTPELVSYYDDKSTGGYIGLIITEHLYISREGMADAGQTSISRDNDIDGLKTLAETIHRNGSKVLAQISHAGSSASPKVTGCDPISASAVVNHGFTGKTNLTPHEMSKEEISLVITKFVDAAERAKKAGFDGVEIHSAHAYLLNQFYSPLVNKRTDEYGGDLHGRIRIHLEIIHAVRQRVGEDFIIAIRLGASDYIDGGSTINEGVTASIAFERAGVDIVDVSGGFCGFMRKDEKKPGYFRDASRAIKEKVSVPVILTGGIVDAKDAECLLESNAADLIGIGRAILKDSMWAKNAERNNA